MTERGSSTVRDLLPKAGSALRHSCLDSAQSIDIIRGGSYKLGYLQGFYVLAALLTSLSSDETDRPHVIN